MVPHHGERRLRRGQGGELVCGDDPGFRVPAATVVEDDSEAVRIDRVLRHR